MTKVNNISMIVWNLLAVRPDLQPISKIHKDTLQEIKQYYLDKLPKSPKIDTKQPMIASYDNGIKVGKQQAIDDLRKAINEI